MSIFRNVCMAIGLVAISFGLNAAPHEIPDYQRQTKLVVGLIEQPPFVTFDGETYAGLAVALTENLAKELNLEIEYKPYVNVDQLISGIESWEYDLCINPSAPNIDLMDKVDFTHPFMVSNLAIAFKSQNRHVIFKLLSSVFSLSFLTGIILIGFIILFFGALTWFFERKKNTNHFPNTRKGVWEAFWWSAVTMTTVGYGDKTPRTTGGRIVAITWMFTALLIISSYTGSVASLLTVNELSLDIKSLNDLRQSKIVVVNDNTAEQFLILSHIPYTKVENVKEAVQLVLNGKADALLHNETSIRHVLSIENIEDEIAIAPAKYSNKFYGLAMPKQHPLFDELNEAMIRVTNSLEWKLEMGSYRIE